MAANVGFYYGKKVNYDALTTKDDNVLYFTTDTCQLFKGAQEYTKSVQFGGTLPQTTEARQGVIYVLASNMSAYFYNGTAYVQISKGYAAKIPDAVTADDDNTVPTTKAVADYVTAKIADVQNAKGVFVTDVTYDSKSGNLQTTKGEGSTPTNVALTGLTHDPTYDATTRTITIPTWGGEDLVIALGKDAFVSSGTYNAETKEIELTLTTGDVVKIPSQALVDIYTGVATPTTTTTINEKNEVSVAVKVSATANNQLVLEDDGLYVGLPDAYTKAEIDDKLSVINQSVATAKSDAIAAAAEDATTKANTAEKNAKDYADTLNTRMSEKVNANTDALTWKEIPGTTT